MTRVDFYSNVPDKLELARLITYKAYRLGLRIMLHSNDQQLLSELDKAWWEVPVAGFMPHCLTTDDHAAHTPIILGIAPDQQTHSDVLINLGSATPSFFSRFERLIEIVSHDQVDRDLARQRWRFYQQRGYTVANHDMHK